MTTAWEALKQNIVLGEIISFEGNTYLGCYSKARRHPGEEVLEKSAHFVELENR